jgi:hypothetical protein
MLTDLLVGLGTLKIQAEDQPLWSHRLHQHDFRLSGWLFGCFWREGRNYYALGSERGQTPILSRGR